VPDSNRYAPPEVVKLGWDTIKRHPITAVDAYGFGALISEVFNGAFTGAEQIALAKNIPPSMQQSYKRLINNNPKARLSVGHFLEQGSRDGGFFDTPLILLTQGIESLGMKTEQEREEFLRYVVRFLI
jgi:SCY1-like protein 1